MKIEYHPAVEHDIAQALDRYDPVSPRLGEEFEAEVRRIIALAAEAPGRFHQIAAGLSTKETHALGENREIESAVRDGARRPTQGRNE